MMGPSAAFTDGMEKRPQPASQMGRSPRIVLMKCSGKNWSGILLPCNGCCLRNAPASAERRSAHRCCCHCAQRGEDETGRKKTRSTDNDRPLQRKTKRESVNGRTGASSVCVL